MATTGGEGDAEREMTRIFEGGAAAAAAALLRSGVVARRVDGAGAEAWVPHMPSLVDAAYMLMAAAAVVSEMGGCDPARSRGAFDAMLRIVRAAANVVGIYGSPELAREGLSIERLRHALEAWRAVGEGGGDGG